MLNDWKEAFQPRILIRGRDYYESGQVFGLKTDGDDISAYVQGSECYKVKIHLKNGSIDSAYCSCPYFADGNNCKHLAAVMYESEETESEGMNPRELREETSDLRGFSSDRVSVSDLVHEADRAVLEELVEKLAAGNESNRALITKMLSGAPDVKKDGPAMDLTELKAEAEAIFIANSDRHGYIDYSHASVFSGELCDFLYGFSTKLLEQERYLDAFELIGYVFVQLGNTDIDDDGEIMEIAGTCREIWEEITDKCSDEELQQIKQWFRKHSCDNSVIDYMEDILKDFLREVLITPEEMREEMLALDAALAEPMGDGDREYLKREEQVSRRVFLMEKLGAGEEEARSFRFSHDELISVRHSKLAYARQNGQWDEEKRLLNEYRKRDDSKYIKITYTDRLAELYCLTGNVAMEKEELKYSILLRGTCPLKIFLAYKALFTKEEWESERDRLIEEETNAAQRCELLFEEKLYDRLFEEVKESGRIELYDRYGFIFENSRSPEILRFYRNCVEKMAVDARNDARYRTIENYLRRMEQYHGGHEAVGSLASDLREKYPTRKKMADMLSKYL